MPSKRECLAFAYKGIRKQVASEPCLGRKKKKSCQAEKGSLYLLWFQAICNYGLKKSLKESGWEQSTSKRGQLVSRGGFRLYHLSVCIYPILSAIPNLLGFPEGMVRQHCTFQKRPGKQEDTYDKAERIIHSFLKGEICTKVWKQRHKNKNCWERTL